MTTTDNTQSLIWGHINGLHITQAIRAATQAPDALKKAIEETKDIFKAHGFKIKPEQKKKKGPKKPAKP